MASAITEKENTAGGTQRILTGLQPSGRVHIGNYFGAMEPAVRLQEAGDAFYFIADYHSLTTVNDATALRQHVADLAIDFLACGLDPEKATFFRQSDVPEVTELTWILSSITPMGLLERCHSYKDKTAKGIAASHGLFAYPVLMAADILLYGSQVVPVGKDQKQHVEVTRDIALKFNDLYGDTLVVPEPQIREATASVRGPDGQKMSKSYGNTIALFGDEKPTRKKVMRLVTDSTPVEEAKPTEDSIILEYFRLFASPEEVMAMEEDFRKGGTGYGDFKKRVFEAMWQYFAPMRERRAALTADPDYVADVLSTGAQRAQKIAQETLEKVRSAVGLDR